MLRDLGLAATSAIAFAAAANAADIDVPGPGGPGSYKDAPYVAGWAGFYAGINGGYAWSDHTGKFAFPDFPGIAPQGDFGGGGQIGYNWQGVWHPNLVLGVEADIQVAGIEDNAFGNAIRSRLDWFGTVRGRLGYAFGPSLLYATGGFAYGGLRNEVISGDGYDFKSSETATGYAVGGGWEYRLNPAWSVKAEYQFIDLGRNDPVLAPFGSACALFGLKCEDDAFHTVRAGISYHIRPGPDGGFAGDALADGPAVQAPPAPVDVAAWSWAGPYIGVHAAAYAGRTKFDDPFGASLFGDGVVTPGYGTGGQIGYNWQAGNVVYGLEADAAWLASDGTMTCAAFSGFYASSNCGARPDAFGTVTGRAGWALGPEGHTLAYAKGGFAWQHNEVSATLNNNFFFPLLTDSKRLLQAGWTAGAGIEQALTPASSVKFEYGYMNFGPSGGVAIQPSVFGPVVQGGQLFFYEVPGASAKVSSDAHVFKLGLNYKLGEDPLPPLFGAPADDKAPDHAWGPWGPGWEFEAGGRYWYSWGRLQKDWPAYLSVDNSLVSRLTFENTANTGEFFGRIDTPVNVFLKGYIGGGGIGSGHLNDEDWAIALPLTYSNTLSSRMTGPLSYGTIDLGYDFLRGPGYKVGAFAGYNRYTYTLDTGGCVQIANPFSACSASGLFAPLPASTTVVIEDGTWDSLRAGISAETMLFDRWKIGGEVAYIPYTKYTGQDQHPLRDLVISQDGSGRGVQAEASLSYMITDMFSVGAGARYWGLWTSSGSDVFTFAGQPPAPQPRNDTYRTERVGITFQGSLRF